jgi:hypothetical protein
MPGAQPPMEGAGTAWDTPDRDQRLAMLRQQATALGKQLEWITQEISAIESGR